MLKHNLLWHLLGGSTKSLFWWFLASGPQVVPKRPPGGAQGCPESSQVPTLMIYCRFGVDFDVIFGSFWCPSHNMNIKIWVAFSLRLKSARVSKFGQHSPTASSHKKVTTKIPPPNQKVIHWLSTKQCSATPPTPDWARWRGGRRQVDIYIYIYIYKNSPSRGQEGWDIITNRYISHDIHIYIYIWLHLHQ